jgi:hypothetical protein
MAKKGTTPYVTHFIFRPLMSIVGVLLRLTRKKAHRRPDEKMQSSQANSGCMLSGPRRVHPVIVAWSTANRRLMLMPDAN